jgi:hypothetical protein
MESLESWMATIQQPVVGFSWPTAVDLSKKHNRERLSGPAIKGFFAIAARWSLKDEDTRSLLGGVSSGTFYELKGGTPKILDQDQLTRISLLIGIYKALNILFSQKLADAWVTLPNENPMFAGESPLNYMRAGSIPALIRVRQLLDARRGGR